MPNYSYVHSGRLFDLILPKPVVDICMKASPGDCSQFQFVESVESVYDVQSGAAKPSLCVTTLPDGSWNLTNNKDPACSDISMKHLYIIVTEQYEKAPDVENIEEAIEHLQPDEIQENITDENNEQVTIGDNFQEHQQPQDDEQHEEVSGDVSQAVTSDIPQEIDETLITDQMSQNDMLEIKPQIDEEESQEEYPSYVQEEEDPGSGMDHDYMGPTQDVDNIDELSSEEELPSQVEQDTPGLPKGPVKKAITCSICPGQSKDYWNYLKHVKRYHTEHPSYWTIVQELKPLLRAPCKTCGKVFSTPKILLEHEQKVHNQSIGAVCAQCGKIFKSSHHLKQHIKYLHLRKAGTFLCDLCPAKFSTSNVLREHVKYSHSNVDRTNKCTECDFKYAFQKQFYEHFTRVHGPKKHVCPYCDYKCATRWYMKKHVMNCAPKTSHMGGPHSKRQKVGDSLPSENTSIQQEPNQALKMDKQSTELNLEQIIHHAQVTEEVQEEHTANQEVYQITETSHLEEFRNAAVTEEVAHAEIEQREDNTAAVITAAAVESNVISEDAEGKRTRISLMGTDGTQQTIEIIIPNQ